jgi:hypothetical protein
MKERRLGAAGERTVASPTGVIPAKATTSSPLLSPEDVAVLLRLPSAGAARKFITRSLPAEAVLRVGRRVRVRRDELMNFIGLDRDPRPEANQTP